MNMIRCHVCEPGKLMPAVDFLLHLKVEHGIEYEFLTVEGLDVKAEQISAVIDLPAPPKLRVWEAEVDALEAKIARVRNPIYRWRYRMQVAKLRREISEVREEQIQSFLTRYPEQPAKPPPPPLKPARPTWIDEP